MSTRNYSSIYDIKDFAINELAPKYFDLDDVNQLNVGLLGYTTDLIANTTEDMFNATTIYLKEMFPNKAIIPETIYNNASLFQIDNLFATPAYMTSLLFISEDDIFRYGTKKESTIEFNLDSGLKIDIEGKQFMLDYDVKITCRTIRGEWVISAMYDHNFDNSLSDVNNPYIKTRRIQYSNRWYLGLFVVVRQVEKFTTSHSMISNDKINLPTIQIEFENQLANFEVFYKEPGSSTYYQLKKRLYNTPEIKEDFCFYKFKNEQELEISFTTKDFYFKPKFNSDIMVIHYTTSGSEGNFPIYTGDKITVIPQSNTYEYNNNLIMFAYAQTESIGGQDTMTVAELKKVVVEKFSTIDSYTTENDLSLYFSGLSTQKNCHLGFFKKRDDLVERLFNAFVLMDDNWGNKYHTNTTDLQLIPSDYDIEYEQSDRWLLKPGALFTYKEDSLTTLVKIPNRNINDEELSILEKDNFIYTNPFLISVSKKGVIGYYINSIDHSKPVDYTYVNTSSPTQFICNQIGIKRNALIGEDNYKFSVSFIPTNDINKDSIIDKVTGEYTGIVKAMLSVEEAGVEVAFIELEYESYNIETNTFTFTGSMKTDDYLATSNKMRFIDVRDSSTGELCTKLLPMNNVVLNINTFVRDNPDTKSGNRYAYMADYEDFILTNTYSTDTSTVDFILPINLMRSRMKFIPKSVELDTYSMILASVPFVRASSLNHPDDLYLFLKRLITTYNNLLMVKSKIINNYSIDIKFYNTYGKSRYFIVGENEGLLDRVNISIDMSVAPTVGANIPELMSNITTETKNYIETLSVDGTNAIYVSNLIQILENSFAELKYLKFNRINDYDTSIQVIESLPVTHEKLSDEERRNYVPEFITIMPKDVRITII